MSRITSPIAEAAESVRQSVKRRVCSLLSCAISRSARLYRQEIAIAALKTTTTRPLAAQAADELLNISGIAASIVLYPDGSNVIMSARSMGQINVQMILEPLGGGGNAATAGCQMHAVTIKEALDALVASIDKYYES